MIKEIKEIIYVLPGLKGREIANTLDIDKRDVNSALSKNHDGFIQKQWRWFPEKENCKRITLNQKWITSGSFEKAFNNAGCFLTSSEERFIIDFKQECKILLIAGARIIALANQIANLDKKIYLNFFESKDTLSYLDRLGFFDHLDSKVIVFPKRPSTSKAKKYKGNSENLVEIVQIDQDDPSDLIPKQLTQSFVHHTSKDYHLAAFTIFSELIGNAYEHSESKSLGFAALQKYDGIKPHIQTVVSDNGLGIYKTLKRKLSTHYPKLFAKLDSKCIDSDIFLVQEALTKGGLSQLGPDKDLGRGLGLKRSQDFALKFNATITVRQKHFELKLTYKDGKLETVKPTKGLLKIEGTQVCFDFFL